MKECYENNLDFRLYVDRYCIKHKISVDEALTHELIKEIYNIYKDA